jgi:hypothetical protein
MATHVSKPHSLQPSEIDYHRTLFYLGGVLVAGLLLPKGRVADQPNTQCPDKGAVDAPQGTANNSPFVQIYRDAQVRGVRKCAQPFAAILLTSPCHFSLPIWSTPLSLYLRGPLQLRMSTSVVASCSSLHGRVMRRPSWPS